MWLIKIRNRGNESEVKRFGIEWLWLEYNISVVIRSTKSKESEKRRFDIGNWEQPGVCNWIIAIIRRGELKIRGRKILFIRLYWES
jgi:hypothetical protein